MKNLATVLVVIYFLDFLSANLLIEINRFYPEVLTLIY